MNQMSLDAFYAPGKSSISSLILVLKDFNVAWTDRDWHLHNQDVVSLDEKLAQILIQRGIARKVEVPS
jgi:hypothetical protein